MHVNADKTCIHIHNMHACRYRSTPVNVHVCMHAHTQASRTWNLSEVLHATSFCLRTALEITSSRSYILSVNFSMRTAHSCINALWLLMRERCLLSSFSALCAVCLCASTSCTSRNCVYASIYECVCACGHTEWCGMGHKELQCFVHPCACIEAKHVALCSPNTQACAQCLKDVSNVHDQTTRFEAFQSKQIAILFLIIEKRKR